MCIAYIIRYTAVHSLTVHVFKATALGVIGAIVRYFFFLKIFSEHVLLQIDVGSHPVTRCVIKY